MSGWTGEIKEEKSPAILRRTGFEDAQAGRKELGQSGSHRRLYGRIADTKRTL